MFLEDWFEHAVLKEDASLNEAAPRKAKDLGINPDTPPDLNNPNNDDKQPPQKDDNPSPSNNTDQQKDDPSLSAAQPDAVMADDKPQDDASLANAQPDAVMGGNSDDQSSDGTDGDQAGEDNGDNNENGEEDQDTSGEEQPAAPSSINDELKQDEQEIFKDLSQEQLEIKTNELRREYKDLYSAVNDILDKLNDISKTSFDATMIEFVTRKLLELKDIIKDSVTDTFDTRTYIENQVEFQKMIALFNNLTVMVETIYNARVKRVAAEAKEKKSKKDSEDFDIEDFVQDMGW